jgi:hypothetical protein
MTSKVDGNGAQMAPPCGAAAPAVCPAITADLQPAGDVADAPPSNRASARYEEPLLSPLLIGLDWLELSYYGEFLPEVPPELDRLKGLAQSRSPQDQARAVVRLADQYFIVQDKGAGLFGFVLHNAHFYLRVRSARAKQLPAVQVQVRSEHLVQVGPEHAAAEARAIAASLCEIDGDEAVSRIDPRVDFTTSVPIHEWDRRFWLTRASHRNAHSVGDVFTGWAIGQKGDVGFRLYLKTFEIETQSKKFYLHDIWKTAGWFTADPVWRAEFQLRRAALAQFDLRSLRDVLAALPALWAHLTGQWLRLTEANPTDDNRARWPTHPLWSALQTVPWTGSNEPLRRRFRATNAPSDRWIAQAGTAVLTSVMAKDGLVDPDAGLEKLRSIIREHWNDRELLEGAPADQLILERAVAKERKYGTVNLARALSPEGFGGASRVPGEEG